VRVRTFLALLIDAAAGVLDESRSLTQAPIRLNRQNGHAPAYIVRDQQIASLCVDSQMTRRAAASALLIEKPKLARLSINCERAHTTVVLLAGELVDFVDRVKEPFVWMDREKRRVLSFCRQPEWREHSGGGVETKSVDARALRPSVGTDVHN
jgi:hypothetical protein